MIQTTVLANQSDRVVYILALRIYIKSVQSVKLAGYGWEVKIVDKDGNTVKQGEVGELCVKGPGVMRCYYNDKKATDEVLKDGWLLTGDVAKRTRTDLFTLLTERKTLSFRAVKTCIRYRLRTF